MCVNITFSVFELRTLELCVPRCIHAKITRAQKVNVVTREKVNSPARRTRINGVNKIYVSGAAIFNGGNMRKVVFLSANLITGQAST